MRKSKIIKVVSFAVAVLLGMVSAQSVATPTVPTTAIPTFADPTGQIQISQQWAAASGVSAYGPAAQAQISQEYAKAYGVGGAFGPAGQAKINGQWASQFGLPTGPAFGSATPTTQTAVSPLAVAGAPVALLTVPASSNAGVTPGSTTTPTTGIPTPAATFIPAQTAVSGFVTDPVFTAKIAKIQADYATKLQSMELQQEMIELQLELQLMTELAALQAAQAASNLAKQSMAAQQTATPVVATQASAPIPVAASINTPTVIPNSVQAPLALLTVNRRNKAQAEAENEAENEAGEVVENPTPIINNVQAPVAVAATTTETVVVAAIPVTPVASSTPVTPIAAAQPVPIVAPVAPVAPVVPVAPATFSAAPLTTLMTDAQIFAQEKKLLQEIEILKSQRLKNTVTKSVSNYQTILNNQMTEFQLVLDSTVAQLNCDAVCVNTCATAALTLDAKALCLDTCLCYTTPAVPVTPTPAPVVETLAVPVVDTLVVAPQQQVVAEATPVQAAASAQQALFLSEEALVMSANGSISGMVVLASILGLVTLVVAAILHLYNDDNKSLYKNISQPASGNYFSFTKNSNAASNESEEYLLIK